MKTSHDMLPCFEIHQTVRGHKADSKSCSKLLQSEIPGAPKPSCLFDGFRSEFVTVHLFSAKLSALLYLILHVFSSVTKPQVFGINASRIISRWAIMQNALAFWYWPKVKYPRGSRGNENPHSYAAIDVTVSHFAGAGSPQPTGLGFSDFAPKSFWECSGKTLRSQILRRNLDHSSITNAVRVTGPAAFLAVLLTEKGWV